MHVRPRDHVQAEIFWYGYYEREAILTWEAFMQPDSVVIDIGANTGYYTLVAAPKSARVYAFEPATMLRDGLQRNLSLNKLNNVSVVAAAVMDEIGQGEFYLSGPDNTGMSGLQPAENFAGSIEFVNTTTLDHWARSEAIDRIDLIKIDVEGAERKVLSGMDTILTRHRPVLFMEVMEKLLARYNSGVTDIFGFLEKHDYNAFEIAGARTLRPLQEPKEDYTVVFLPRGYILPASITVKARS